MKIDWKVYEIKNIVLKWFLSNLKVFYCSGFSFFYIHENLWKKFIETKYCI